MKKIDWAEVREGYKISLSLVSFILFVTVVVASTVELPPEWGFVVFGILVLVLINYPIINAVLKRYPKNENK